MKINFNKDLLVIDLEMTGLDVNKHEIIQIAGILLDKKTLKEKKSFSTFVKPHNWEQRSKVAMKINGITQHQLNSAPSLKSALQKLIKTFGQQIILATYGDNLDVVFLLEAFKKAELKYPYDYHTFNMWVLFYTYLSATRNLKNTKRFAGFKLEDLAKLVKVPIPNNRHDALVDCRFEASILRKVLENFQINTKSSN